MDGAPQSASLLVVVPETERPIPLVLERLAHEYELRRELDTTWAIRPLELISEGGRAALVLEDPGGELLQQLLGAPMDLSNFLQLALGITVALGRVHERGIVHKDLKPAHIFVNCFDGAVRLTGFGIASRLQRERQAPAPPEFIAGTLAYMSPEQTGRMNRSVDLRGDFYALGVTFYQMLTGQLPFFASDPMEWVHCHIARRPISPSQRIAHIPKPVSSIVMKLLAKTAEDRYQTASGIARDLRRCFEDWEGRRWIDDFSLAQSDVPNRLMIPEKLYGREREADTLLSALDRVRKGAAPALVLVSGYPGIGKSSIVNEIYKPLVPPRGLFVSGKFDQYKQEIPYSTIAQALQTLVRSLLGKSDAELTGWRNAIVDALGFNGQLMVELVPELKLIIGEQPPVTELPAQDAQRRFQLVFRRFLGVFARPEHPLAVFLDDLQWLDAATLDLIEDLLIRGEPHHLLLIGAYRDNEVDIGHPLMCKLEAIRQAGVKVEQIRLTPLNCEHVRALMADSLRCLPSLVGPLAEVVNKKAGGNPFFVIQFLQILADEGVLAFDLDASRWRWDIEHLHAKDYSDNVVQLVVGKLGRLSIRTQKGLQELACLGASADIQTLSAVLGVPEEQVHEIFWDAIRQEVVERRGHSYRFVHDRMQEAAYSLVPEDSRAAVHLRIGRVLTARAPPERREESIFEIVCQLNRGSASITSWKEREQLAEFNLIAARRAKASSAYASALIYLEAAQAQLDDHCWEHQRDLSFQLGLQRAECEFLIGDLAAAEKRLASLSARAQDRIERATTACLRIDLYTTLNKSDRAVAVGLEYLQYLGINWSAHPSEREVQEEYASIWSRLGDRKISDLAELPLMSDPTSLAMLDVITKILPPALFTDANLFSVASCRAVTLSIDEGNSDGSCVAYVWLGMIAGPRFANYNAGFEFGRLGYELVESRGLKRFAARTYLWFAQFVVPWVKHIRSARDLMRQAFEAANKAGDLTIAGYACNNLNTNLLAGGDPLALAQHEAENGFNFAQKARFSFVCDIIAGQLGLIRTLRGLTRKFGCFDDDYFNEDEFERHLASDGKLALPECWYWTRKLQARFFAGDYDAALEAAKNAERLLWTTPSIFEKAECYFYGALTIAASCESLTSEQRSERLETLVAKCRQLEAWADNCPENFENRAALVGAEIARIQGRELDAERLYERAIRSSHSNGFIHNEAVANELAARFYATRGFEKIARLYLQDARYCYLRWGADGKVRQLDERYPYISAETSALHPKSFIGEPVERLDLATVIQVSQAVAGEIMLEKLIDTLMRAAVSYAGAERAVLLPVQGVEQPIAAEATIGEDGVIVHLHAEPACPESVLQYVFRTQETLVLDDAAAQSAFATDPYICQRRARSILCLPLITQTKLIGVLYLENNLAPRVFAPARNAVLKLLASQAAIAIENARLYRDLAAREAKIRRLVDANIIGICIASRTGEIIEANDAFLKIVGYDKVDLSEGRVRWTTLTPPEWQDCTVSAMKEIEVTGAIRPYEKEYVRKNGTRVPVLVGSAAFDERRDQGVIFVLDLTERKLAEASARQMEKELAHANRVATMGLLTASIAHEVQQPIAAAVTNAQAALRFLRANPVNLNEVRDILEDIANDGNRASEIIGRIRAIIKKEPPRKDCLEINCTIREIIDLTRGEAAKHGISVRAEFAECLPAVRGDRVELQQVILNLVVNAIEAMNTVDEGQRELVIATAATAPGVLVSVRDSGPGLPPSALDRLFTAFYTTKPSGLGLGLSICRSIVEAHGGRLIARSNIPKGALFEFTVPAAER